MYKIACTYGIHFYLQLFMQHQYKPYDFAEIHIAFSPTINLVNMCGVLLMFIFIIIITLLNTHHITFPAVAIVGVFITVCLMSHFDPQWEQVVYS